MTEWGPYPRSEREEHCIECDALTGRAGECEDSLYTEDGKGPFCEDCFAEAERCTTCGFSDEECTCAFEAGGLPNGSSQ